MLNAKPTYCSQYSEGISFFFAEQVYPSLIQVTLRAQDLLLPTAMTDTFALLATPRRSDAAPTWNY